MKQILLAISWIFSELVFVRNRLFETGVKKTVELPVPVISIGNITVGGTGKTPMILNLACWAEANGLPVGVVSRGYRRKSKDIQKVSLERPDAASFFGDEPVLIKKSTRDVPVFVGADRVMAAKALLDSRPVKMVFADDAFQHRKLSRDMDIVIIDIHIPQSDYKLLPLGRAREPLSSLFRADYVVLNHKSIVDEEKANSMRELIEKKNSGHKIPIVEAKYVHASPQKIGERVLLVTGVAAPKAVYETARAAGYEVLEHLVFKDHHEYTDAEINAIRERFHKISAERILTTEKDFVKLEKRFNLPIAALAIQMQVFKGAESFYESLRTLCR